MFIRGVVGLHTPLLCVWCIMELIPSIWQLCMYRVEPFHPILINNLVNLLVCYCPCPVNMLLLVIFHFRINEPVMFKALIEQFNLIQHVNISTHVAGNTRDLALTRDDVSVTSIPTDYSVNLTTVLLSLTYHVFPLVLSGSLLLTGNGNRLMFHLCNLTYLRLSINFHLLISALLWNFTMILEGYCWQTRP